MQSQYHPAEAAPAGNPPMNCDHSSCSDCPGRIVCRCLQVTEDVIVDTITRLELHSVREIRRHTGAGEGCTCCHRELLACLEQHAVQRAACA
jgi:bacterioferritin-associated ferredoxin